MITSSLNSNVSRRTEYFGMLRCLGASKKQIIRFVKKEALEWCKISIPIGLLAGTIMVWVLSALLKFLSPQYFDSLPLFGISWVSLLGGTFIGIITVLLAARNPAKRAAYVSPLTAVSGNANEGSKVRRSANTELFKVDMALGVHHALGSRKNLVLMGASFAFSIILFLAFSVMVDFMSHAIRPLQPYAPDISIVSPDNTCSVDRDLIDYLEQMDEVKSVFSRSFAYDVPIALYEQEGKANLISYEEKQFSWAEKDIKEGNLEDVMDGRGILAVYSEKTPFKIGDTVIVNFSNTQKEVMVSALASYSPFNRNEGVDTIICSEDIFEEITGQDKYTIIDIQLKKNADEAVVDEIRTLAGENVKFF